MGEGEEVTQGRGRTDTREGGTDTGEGERLTQGVTQGRGKDWEGVTQGRGRE